MHKTVETKKGRFVTMEQNPDRIGKFGEWKVTGNFATKPEADSFNGD